MSGKPRLRTWGMSMTAKYVILVFEMLRMDIQWTFMMIPQLVQGLYTNYKTMYS